MNGGGAHSSAMRNDTSTSPSTSILNMDHGYHLSTGGREQVVCTEKDDCLGKAQSERHLVFHIFHT